MQNVEKSDFHPSKLQLFSGGGPQLGVISVQSLSLDRFLLHKIPQLFLHPDTFLALQFSSASVAPLLQETESHSCGIQPRADLPVLRLQEG